MAAEGVGGAAGWRCRPPEQAEWRVFRELLADAALPAEGIGPGSARFLVAVDSSDRVIGGVGVEGAAPDGLLRSLVVRPHLRGSGLGVHLLTQAEALAQSAGIRRLYLLTTTAEDFFAARGYLGIRREDVPADIRATEEFVSLCPDSAVAMTRSLGES